MSWAETTLGEICSLGGGNIQTGPFGSQLHASDYVEAGIPSVMPQNIGDNTIIETGIARITENDAARLGKYRLHTNDIVYSRRGDVERRALVRAENDGWLCGTGCLKVSFGNTPVADPTFISQYLGTEETREWIVRHAVGATMLNLNTRILSAVPLTIPPLQEQQAIAEVLGALDDKIAANTKLAATADALASAILSQAVEGNKTVQLSEIADITMGSSPVGSTLNESGEGTVFYQGVRDFGVRFPNNRIWTTSPARMARQGDTLISVRAPVGRVNIANENLCVGRGLAAAYSSDSRPATLFHLLKVSVQVWEPFEAEGTVFGSINKKQLAEIELPHVRHEQSVDVEKMLQSLETRIATSLQENDILAATRDALLPQLMSGKLRARDAESLVSTVA